MTDLPIEPTQAANQNGTASRRAHEAVIHITRVQVGSRDIARGVDAEGDGSRIRARACARSLERGYRASCRAHEAVKHIAAVQIASHYILRGVDAEGGGSRICARACARSLERGYRASRRAHEAVKQIARVTVQSRDSPCRVY